MALDAKGEVLLQALKIGALALYFAEQPETFPLFHAWLKAKHGDCGNPECLVADVNTIRCGISDAVTLFAGTHRYGKSLQQDDYNG